MLTLLKIEWLKVKKYKPFWVIFAFLLLLCPSITIVFGKILAGTKGTDGINAFLGSPFAFPTVFNTASYINNGLNIAWGMLLILMIGNEFQTKTMRQNVIDGQSRSDIITSKLLVVLIFSFLSAILTMVSGFITGAIYSPSGFVFDVKMFETFGVSFFAAIMQMLFALLFAFFIKRPAFGVILYLVYTVLLENLLWFILVLVTRSSYPKLLFTQAADLLTPFPLKTVDINQARGGGDALAAEAPWIACVIYAALILFFLYRYINRTILK